LRKILISFLIISTLVGGYFAYDYWLASPKAKAWDFIPKNAAGVIETNKTLATYDSIRNLDIWSAFNQASISADIDKILSELDSSNTEDSFRTVFGNNASLVAFFPISVSQMDVLLVTELNSSKQRNYLKNSLTFYKESGYRFKKRSYNGFTIDEIYMRSDGEIFSFIRFQDYLIGSFSPFLVEDAIRAFNDPENRSFSTNFEETKILKALTQDEGNLYLNMSELNSFFDLFSDKKQHIVGKSAFLDIDFESSFIRLTGFTFPENDLLSTFSDSPGSFDILDVVPNNTARLAHYSFKDAESWRANLVKFDQDIVFATAQMKSKFDVDVDFLFSQIFQEVAVAELEVVGSEKPDRLVFFDTKDINEVNIFLNQAAKRMAGDSIFTDRMGTYVVQKLDKEMSTAILGKRSELGDECYYIIHRKYVIMSNSLDQIKRLIGALEADNTWRKSIQISSMLEQTNREANYSVFVQMPRSWKQLMNSLKPNWRSFFSANEVGFKSVEYLSFQFSKTDDKFYTNVVAYQPESPRQPAKVRTAKRITLASEVITKPYLIRSHVNKSLEILAQDSAFQLYHISSDFEIVWANRLDESIIGEIIPVDYYLNAKKQYAFSTASQLHIIDRTGMYLDGFPMAIPSPNPIQHFSVVDYDGSKNYRFMLTDAEGGIYLLDKSGNLLPGWTPKATGSHLVLAPRHIRIAGKDAFIVVEKKGMIDLISRKGVSYPGFPLNLKSAVGNDYFTKATGSFETSEMTILTDEGELVRLNFGGQIMHREQLFKPTANTSFELVSDVMNNTFIILRSSDQLWEVLDATGVKLFEKSYVKNQARIVQFYRFGGGKSLILLTDPNEKFLTIYNLEGKMLTQKPLRSSTKVSVLFSENEDRYTLYLAHDSLIEKLSLE